MAEDQEALNNKLGAHPAAKSFLIEFLYMFELLSISVWNNTKIMKNDKTIRKTANSYKPSYSEIVTGKMENNVQGSIKMKLE